MILIFHVTKVFDNSQRGYLRLEAATGLPDCLNTELNLSKYFVATKRLQKSLLGRGVGLHRLLWPKAAASDN